MELCEVSTVFDYLGIVAYLPDARASGIVSEKCRKLRLKRCKVRMGVQCNYLLGVVVLEIKRILARIPKSRLF